MNRFLDNAVGSSCEIKTQLYLAFELNFIDNKVKEFATDEIRQIRKLTIS